MRIFYTSGKEKLLSEVIRLSTGDIKLMPVDKALYTALVTHTSLADVPSGARCAAGVTTTGRTFTGGRFDCADVNYGTIPTGKTVSAYVAYQQGTADADSWLLSYTDEQPDGSAINLPGNGSAVVAPTPEGIIEI
jgi:hypothetical protein